MTEPTGPAQILAVSDGELFAEGFLSPDAAESLAHP